MIGWLIVDAHLSLERGPWRAKALAMWGYLKNADDISARNDRLSNLLNVLRTPVAEHALAVWGELGFNIAPKLGLDEDHRIEPYVRFDYADSVFNPRTELFDNPRFADFYQSYQSGVDTRHAIKTSTNYHLLGGFVIGLVVNWRSGVAQSKAYSSSG